MHDLKINVKGFFKKDTYTEIRLSLITFKEEGLTFIYSPALDLTGYGKTFDDARKSFVISLEEFLRYSLNKKTIDTVLKALGWKVKGGVRHKQYSPPELYQMLRDNKYLSEIFEEKQFRKFDAVIPLPVAA